MTIGVALFICLQIWGPLPIFPSPVFLVDSWCYPVYMVQFCVSVAVSIVRVACVFARLFLIQGQVRIHICSLDTPV
jgi:hypothetical protein